MSEHGGCHGEDCNNKKVNKLSHYHIFTKEILNGKLQFLRSVNFI